MQRSSRAQRVGRSTERQGKPCGMGPLRARRDAAMPALPTRPGKPRRRGITSLIDRGPDLGGWLGLRGTRDFLEVAAPYVDYAKIYAVQSLMLPAAWIARKIRLYRRYRVEPYAGGVLMELAWQQRRMTGYFRLVKKLGFQTIEVSENFVKLSPKERRATIREAVEEHDLSVVWEYGSKEPWAPLLVDDFVAAAHEALESGAERRRHRQNGLTLAVDIAKFCDPATFQREVGRLAKAVKALPRDPGVDEILVPGERGNRTLERRSRDGIPIPRTTFDELKGVADRLGVPMLPSSSRP